MRNVNNYDLIKEVKFEYYKIYYLIKELFEEGFESIITIVECFYDIGIQVKNSLLWDLEIMKKVIRKV